MDKIRIGIVGYGNIGKGVEKAIARNEDMELAAVFTRRDPASVKIATETAVVKTMEDMKSMKGEIDVMVLCGGSATDLPVLQISIPSTALIPTQEFRSILKMWIKRQRLVEMWESFP